MKIRGSVILLAMVLAVGIIGCSSYYTVKDPTTDKVFYTTEIREKDAGVTFIDAKSGAKVTLQNSEISEIEKDAFKAALSPPQEPEKK